MTTQQLKDVLLAEHKRDVKLMLIGYGIIAGVALLIIGFLVWLLLSAGVSIGSAASGVAGELAGNNVPTYVKFVLPIGFLLAAGYLFYEYYKMAKRPQTIEEFVKHIENGTRVISINDSKNYRIKIPLYVVNYHTGAVQSFAMVLEGKNKAYVLPVPFALTDEVKDLLNENS